MAHLKRHIMFEGIGLRGLEKLSYFFHHRTYNRNSIVYKEGDPVNEFYLIQKGSFKITKTVSFSGKMKEIDVGIIGKGELFGEEDVLDKTTNR